MYIDGRQMSQNANSLMGGSHSGSYSWHGVMEFLREQERNAQEREKILLTENQRIKEKLSQYEDELAKQININKELIKKYRVMEYAMIQQRKANRGSGNQQNLIMQKQSNTIQGVAQPQQNLNNTLNNQNTITNQPQNSSHRNQQSICPIKKVTNHHRGNSDGIQNIAKSLLTAHHKRGSSGSNGQLKQFDESIEAGLALLQQSLEQQNEKNISRAMAHNFYRHQKNNSNEADTIQSQSFLQLPTQKNINKNNNIISDNNTNNSFQIISSQQQQIDNMNISQLSANSTIPQKKRQKSNGQQIQQNDNDKGLYLNTTASAVGGGQVITTQVQVFGTKSGEIAQKRKWIVSEQNQQQIDQHQEMEVSKKQRLSQIQRNKNQQHNLNKQVNPKQGHSMNVNTSNNPNNQSILSSNSTGNNKKYSHLQNQLKKAIYWNKHSLKSHMDGVRGLQILPSINTLVSASEDSTIKCWDLGKLVREQEQLQLHYIEPIITLRAHSEPILSLSSLVSQKEDFQLFLSGSSKGKLKLWRLPHQLQNIQQYCQNSQEINSSCLIGWDEHQNLYDNQPIWDIKMQQINQDIVFLTVCADNNINLHSIGNIQQIEQNQNDYINNLQNSLLTQIKRSNQNGYLLMPTCCHWLNYPDQTNFLVTYQEPLISLFDANTCQEKQIFQFKIDESRSHVSQQMNKIMIYDKIVVTGTEDNLIRIFDLNSSKQIKTIVGHTDSISSLQLVNNQNLNINTIQQIKGQTTPFFVSGGHDGSIRGWDLRTFTCTFDICAHRKKYDEGVLSICYNDKFPQILVSGGADSIIKIFNEQQAQQQSQQQL